MHIFSLWSYVGPSLFKDYHIYPNKMKGIFPNSWIYVLCRWQFYPKDGGNRSFQTVSAHVWKTTQHHRRLLHSHHCQNHRLNNGIFLLLFFYLEKEKFVGASLSSFISDTSHENCVYTCIVCQFSASNFIF